MLPSWTRMARAVMEEKEIEIPMFRPVKVFDVSQTDGKPLPEAGLQPVRDGAAL